MIRAYCRTNLDDFKRAEWPDSFVALPRVGDYVEGIADGPASRPRLRVVSVTHKMRKPNGYDRSVAEPIVEIELHR